MNKNIWKTVDIQILSHYLIFIVEGERKTFSKYEYVKNYINMNISKKVRKLKNVLYYNILPRSLHYTFLYCVDGGYMRYYCRYYENKNVYIYVSKVYKNGNSKYICAMELSFDQLINEAKFFSSINDSYSIL